MQSLSSPWAETFEEFARSIRKRAIMVAPFITEQPLERLAYQLDTNNLPQITILTNLAVDSLLQGSVNGQAIADFCKAVPTTTVRHLPGLHAKAYVADEHTAIITSGNLTYNSLHQNYEYGIQISSPVMVREIASDLQEYGNLGAQVSLQELEHIADVSGALRDKHRKAMNSARASLRQEFEDQIETTRESLRQLRGKPGESANSIFSRTLLYVLKSGPLTTREIQPLVQNIHSDLCNDDIDRVINGIRFGKEWKHRVRGAQVDLSRSGRIELVEGKWQLVRNDN